MKRKLRKISGCLVLTIPSQICDLYGYKENDYIVIEPIGSNELRLKKED